VPQESDQRSSDLDFSGHLFLRLVFFPLISKVSTFSEIGLHSLSDLRSGGNMTFKLGYSGSRRPGDATKPCPISKKKWGKRRNWDVRSPKKSEK